MNNVKVKGYLIDDNWVIADVVINKKEKKIRKFQS